MRIARTAATSLPTFGNDRMAAYLVEGFWADFDDRPRRFNLGTEGGAAKAGVLQYHVEHISPAARDMAEAALALYAEALGFSVQRAERQSSKVDLSFDDRGRGASTLAYMNDEGLVGLAEVNVEAAWLERHGDAVGDYAFLTYLHEIAHAFGLGHAGHYDGTAVFVSDTTDPAYRVNSNVALDDSWQMTIMSYLSQRMNPTVAADFAIPISPMIADWIAFERLYGPTQAYSGNTIWGVGTSIESGPFARLAELADENAFTLIDAGGVDLLDLSRFAADQRIDLRAERHSDVGGLVGNMGIARGTLIERLRSGAGNDALFGNEAANRIEGGAGVDALWGADGADRLDGGFGPDRLYGGKGADVLVGGAGADRLAGEADADVLIGGAGADVFVFRPEAALRLDRIAPDGETAAFEGAGRTGGDRIDVSALDADLTRPGNQAFVFGHEGPGGVWVEDAGPSTHVQARQAGGGACLRALVVDGAVSAAEYVAGDFIL